MRRYHKGTSIFLSPSTGKKNWSLSFLLLLLLLLPTYAYAAAVNINTANTTLLDTLPGIGPTKAAAIVSYREAHGPFKRTEDIQEVSGIGPSTFAKLSSHITVGEAAAAASTQPLPSPARSQEIQTVVTSSSAPAHAVQTARAPRAATEVAALGAVSATAPAARHTSWVLGVLGVVVFAAGAFMIL